MFTSHLSIRGRNARLGVFAFASWCCACGPSDHTDLDKREVGEASAALMTDEPNQKILGHAGVVAITLPNGAICTGWILSERVVATAAHCLTAFEGSGVSGITIDYMRPGFGRDNILSPSDTSRVSASNFYAGGASIDDFFANPLNPGENNAKHDIGFIRTYASRWPNTRYTDYLRVYNDQLDTLTSVYVYGVGNIFRTSLATDPDDRLRFSHFSVEQGLLGSDLVISTTAGQTERLCRGDSGGPYIKKIDGLNLVAGVHHGTDRDSGDFCPKPGGDQWGEKLTWSSSNDLDWLVSNSDVTCSTYTPSGSGNNYARCFELPFVSDAPDREQRYGSKGNALGILVGALL